MKSVKSSHFYVLLDTPKPRLRSALLGEPEAEFSKFSDPHRRRNPRLGKPLRLGQTTAPVLFFLWLILEFVTLLFGLPMEDI